MGEADKDRAPPALPALPAAPADPDWQFQTARFPEIQQSGAASYRPLISRDERNEYHGITVDRARRVLDALGARLVTRVQLDRSNAPGTGTSR